MNVYHYTIFFLIISFTFKVFARQPKQYQSTQDNPYARVYYETHMLASPSTGQIPYNIREKELLYALSLDSKLQPQFQQDKTGNGGGGSAGTFTIIPWKSRGPYNLGGRTRALALDKTDENIILAGGVSGGVWRSTDRGITWTKTTGSSERHNITHIAQDPNNTNIWYYVTGEARGNSAGAGGATYRGNGIYKSTDGGLTWVLLSSTAAEPTVFGGAQNKFQYNWRIAVNPINSDVYAAAWGGIYKSTDQGNTWTQVLNGGGIASGTARYSDISISSQGVLYATLSSSGIPDKGIFRSTNGNNWVDITPSTLPANFERIVLDIAPSDENTIYFFASTPGNGTNDHSLFKYIYNVGQGNGDGTSNNGGNWTDLSGNLPAFGGEVGNLDQANYNQVISVKPDNAQVVFLGSTNLYRSTDGFASKNNIRWIGGYSPQNDFSQYPNHHADIHTLIFAPSNPQLMLTGHDGGLSITTNNLGTNGAPHPVTWISLNNGYLTSQAYTVALDPVTVDDARLLAGFQDNGKWFSDEMNETKPWREEIGGGDGGFVAIVPNQNIRYISTQEGKVARVEGTNIESPTQAHHVYPAAATGQIFINPFELDPNNYNRMYYPAGTSLWRHDSVQTINTGWNPNGGTNDQGWQKIAQAEISTGTITALAASKRFPQNRIYYGTDDGQIYRLDNAHRNPTRTDISTGKGLPANGYVNCLAIDPTDANQVFAVFSNYGVQSVFYSTNGGDSWTPIGGNLEENSDGSGNGPSVRWIAIHYAGNRSKSYYVATSVGLCSTSFLDGTNTQWQQAAPGVIGNVVVSMVKSRGIDGKLVAVTHGNGIYEANVGKPTEATLGEFSPKVASVGEDITLTGFNFDNTLANNKITINGVEAQIKSATSTQIVITVPTGAQTSKIILESGGNSHSTLDDLIITNLTTIPPTPQNLAVSFENGAIQLNWEYVSDLAEKFEIERALPNQTNIFGFIGEIDQSGRTYADAQANVQSRQFYRIRAVNIRGASSYSNIVTFDPSVLSNEDPKLAKALKVYPNPNWGQFEVSVQQKNLKGLQVDILNTQGLVVFSYQQKPTRRMPVNIAHLASGVYILRIKQGKAYAYRRFIKQ
ncbi:hypothetical protein BKI52_08780 [marine bacterium AO1-C]|nr:hypothetical protein BKI52_08780 [marine bacterium AO1-C]